MEKLLSAGKSIPVEWQTEYREDRISPFIMYPNMRCQKIRRRDCSIKEQQRLIANGTLTECHDTLIKLIGKYGILNSYLTRTYLCHISGGRFDFDYRYMRRIFKELIKYGLVIQYELLHMEENKEKGSPLLYALSGGGIRYLKQQGVYTVHPFYSKPFDIRDVLKTMAVNQFHITFLQQHGRETIVKGIRFYSNEWCRCGVAVQYMLKIQGIDLQILMLAVRNSAGWEKEYLQTLRKVAKQDMYLKQSGIILVICETEYQAMECARRKNCTEEVKNMDVFYVTDTAILAEDDVFGRLIDVSPENDYTNRKTFRLVLKEDL